MPLVPNTGDNALRIVTVAYPNDGRQLKRLIIAILKQKLAACVQRMNYMKSYYIWEGELVKREEKLLVIKTTTDRVERLVKFIEKMHPYEAPEIMVRSPEEVGEGYLEWVKGI